MFQFTHPGRGATLQADIGRLVEMFQFTHPGRGATSATSPIAGSWGVSIHAPREGCDGCACSPSALAHSFNSRTPGGVRLLAVLGLESYHLFQFTHPGRGATTWYSSGNRRTRRFNSRTPGGVRRRNGSKCYYAQKFQFTHPGRGATLPRNCISQYVETFQFTHPGRGATLSFSPLR